MGELRDRTVDTTARSANTDAIDKLRRPTDSKK